MKKIASSKAKTPKAKATVFTIHSPTAKRVSVAGDFNNWDTTSLNAKKDAKGNWAVKATLSPGRHEYKFFVDGSWMNDPARSAVSNIYGSQNSVVEIK
jgi:1,4-alpha-glucan branching enzyme